MAWIRLTGGHPCRGARYRLWISVVSLFGWRTRRERTGGSCAGGSGSVPRLGTSGSAALLPMGSLRIVRVVPIRPRCGPTVRSKIGSWRCVMAIRHGAPARSGAVSNARGRRCRRCRPCTRFCGGMVAWLPRSVRLVLTGGSRRKRRTSCGRWTSRAGCGSPTAHPAIR